MQMNGVTISTDDRMLPASQRGYAPIIRGNALTTAKVTVFQNKSPIYQTTVPQGSFVIDDLYSTNYQGELEVIIEEADGRKSAFTVPFSAVPASMRAGATKYNFALGQATNFDRLGSEAYFSEIVGQHGISNQLTAFSGLRFADNYRSVLFGGVINTSLGAFGSDVLYSNSTIDSENENGWKIGGTYSYTYTGTKTIISLASYHHSTEGFIELNDFLAKKQNGFIENDYYSMSYKAKDQISLTLSQPFERYGMISLSGTKTTYRGISHMI